jgi:hypothetical protein
VSGRPIIAIERGDPDNPKKALVVRNFPFRWRRLGRATIAVTAGG